MFHVLPFRKTLNRVLLNSVFSLAVLITFATQMRAETVSNFGQWRNFNSLSKTTYVAGTIDTFLNPLQVIVGQKKFKEQFLLCLKDFNISAGEIVTMIDNFYLNSNNWGYSPQEAIKYQLVEGHCFQYLSGAS